jgi:CheY-like chemotaxis protein
MKTPTILLIEDNDQNAYLTTYLLEKSGCQVVWVKSGLQGIVTAERVTPDLILLDVELPEMNGYAVARELRKRPSLAVVPIIAVTSYAMVGDREKALDAGCTDYIEKPINPDTFVSQVARHLPGAEGGGSPKGADHVQNPDC